MADFIITPESLDTMAATLRRELGDIQSTLDELERKIGELESSWDGKARDAYSKAQRDWSAKFNDMKMILNGIADMTERASTRYAEGGAAAAAAFGNAG